MSSIDSWFWLDSGPGGAAFNMALDEALLEAAARLGRPTLRFYGWREAAATFGYFQKIAEIELVTLLRPLIRRPTGGGLVPHAADWTYCVAVPPGHSWHALKAEQSYLAIHRWIQTAFNALGLATELAACCRKEIPGQCFAGYEKHDLLFGGRKLAGAAQRRTRNGLLIQGSVQPAPRGVERPAWQEAMLAAASAGQRVAWRQLEPDAELMARAGELERGKYSRDDYNRKR